jgi:anaerobic magnesium-protoporphyrin IX monomethyl ester cyclase
VADVTLLNLNMLYLRYAERIERERHVPLGPLYLVAALERAGCAVDFRDYQFCDSSDPFGQESIADYLADSAPIVLVSCMMNLLPFTLLALGVFKARYPDRIVVLGGVGPTAIEASLLERFPFLDAIACGEGERTVVELVQALQAGADLGGVKGIVYRDDGHALFTPPRPRIANLDEIPFPAFHHVDLGRYDGYGMVTSRGCPYPCTFCSVAPIWGRQSFSRSNDNILAEMRFLHQASGVDLFLFQDEFFVSSKERVLSFCRALKASGLHVQWKAFGRVNLTDVETMEAMADAGCVEIRYGVESGSARVLERVKKGFTPEEALDTLAQAVGIFSRTDAFYMWGFPFETMDDFYQTAFQMLAVRAMGARILPSLLSLLPQTDLYREFAGVYPLEFCPSLIPEYMLTGHEVCEMGYVSMTEEYRYIFDFIAQHPDLFPSFFHLDLEGNILPKFQVLKEMGFYEELAAQDGETESCGAHSPRIPICHGQSRFDKYLQV